MVLNYYLNHINQVAWLKRSEIYDFTISISSVKVHKEYWLEFDNDK